MSHKADAFRPFGKWEKEHDWRKDWRVSRRLTLLFTRQFSALLTAGLNIVPSLQVLEDQVDAELAPVIQELAWQLMSGQYLSVAMSKFPRVFPQVYVAMVRVGETTGGLNRVFRSLCEWLSGEEALLRKVKAALTYPIIVLICSTAMGLYLFLQVMPGFVTIFEDLETELPLLTRVLMLLTQALANPVLWVTGVIGLGLAIRFARDRFQTEQGGRQAYRIMLHIPQVGETVRLITAARFCSALSALTATGANLPTALKLSCLATGNPLMKEESRKMINTISEGGSLSCHFDSHPNIYPYLLPQMMAVGEETSRIPQIMTTTAHYFREEVERKFDTLTALLEPLMLLVSSVAVGIVLLGVFSPLYSFLGDLG
jgi:type II secretory pathway component PulF